MQISLIKTYFFQVESFQPLQILASNRIQIENDNFKNSTFASINFNINKLSLIIIILWLNNRKKTLYMYLFDFHKWKLKVIWIHQYKQKNFYSMLMISFMTKLATMDSICIFLSLFLKNQEKSPSHKIFQFNLLSYICFIAPRFELQKLHPKLIYSYFYDHKVFIFQISNYTMKMQFLHKETSKDLIFFFSFLNINTGCVLHPYIMVIKS